METQKAGSVVEVAWGYWSRTMRIGNSVVEVSRTGKALLSHAL
jgi:hypothetical protein